MELIINDKNKTMSLGQHALITTKKLYELVSRAHPRLRKQILVSSLGIESLNHIEDYEKHYKVKSGDVVIDAGAHVGVLTKHYSHSVGKNGLVIAIEPDFRALGCLVTNIYPGNNVKIIPAAAWNEDDVMPMFFMDDNIGMSSLLFTYKNGSWHPVRAYRIDTIVKDLGIKHINFIKMDIEASELRALDGMTETLKVTDALAIAAYHNMGILENRDDKTYPKVIEILKDAGFNVIVENGFDGEIVYANRGDFE
jgi:FkbM family methyltransferase